MDQADQSCISIVLLTGLPGLLKTSLNSASNVSHLDAYTGSAVWPCTTLLFTCEPSTPCKAAIS